MDSPIKDYYENLATTYDENRFANSYGQFIDHQERQILNRWIQKQAAILDMGCGTGRFLEYATHGLDVSQNMLNEAQQKFPKKKLVASSATKTPFEKATFNTVFSFHVLMHLDRNTTNQVFQEVDRILKKEGTFIFDVPSKKRRTLTNYKTQNWHGANHFTIAEIQEQVGEKWKIEACQGILFLPIHRLPVWLRQPFRWLDTLLCRSFLKEYASYLVFKMTKI